MDGVRVSVRFGEKLAMYTFGFTTANTRMFNNPFDFILELHRESQLQEIFHNPSFYKVVREAFEKHLKVCNISAEDAFPLMIGGIRTEAKNRYAFYMIHDESLNEDFFDNLFYEYRFISAFFGYRPSILFNGRLTDPVVVHYSTKNFCGERIFSSEEELLKMFKTGSSNHTRLKRAIEYHRMARPEGSAFPCSVAYRTIAPDNCLAEFYMLDRDV